MSRSYFIQMMKQKDERIAELEKLNKTLESLMRSGERRGVEKATEELSQILVQKDEEIAGLENECEVLAHDLCDARNESKKQINRIAELENSQPKWISVEDELPESTSEKWSTPVIAMCDCGLIYRLSCMNGHWQRTKSFAENESKKVLYWMPQPPKSEVK